MLAKKLSGACGMSGIAVRMDCLIHWNGLHFTRSKQVLKEVDKGI